MTNPIPDHDNVGAHLPFLELEPYRTIFAMIAAERGRQEEFVRAGKFSASCADAVGWFRKMPVLAEETGEVAKVLNDSQTDLARNHREDLIAELVQVAAVAVAWLESLGDARSRCAECGLTLAWFEVDGEVAIRCRRCGHIYMSLVPPKGGVA